MITKIEEWKKEEEEKKSIDFFSVDQHTVGLASLLVALVKKVIPSTNLSLLVVCFYSIFFWALFALASRRGLWQLEGWHNVFIPIKTI